MVPPPIKEIRPAFDPAELEPRKVGPFPDLPAGGWNLLSASSQIIDNCFVPQLEPIETLIGPVTDPWRNSILTAERVYRYSLNENIQPHTEQWDTDLKQNSEWMKAKESYIESAKKQDGNEAGTALENLFITAANVAGIKDRAQLSKDLEEMVEERQESFFGNGPTFRCGPRWIDAGYQKTKELLAKEQHVAAVWVEEQVQNVIKDSLILNTDDEPMELSGVENGIYAEILSSYGATVEAREYFQKAAIDAPTEVGELSYQLRAHQQLSAQERIADQNTIATMEFRLIALLDRAHAEANREKKEEQSPRIVIEMPPGMKSASPDELAEYPTIIYSTITDGSGLQRVVGEPVTNNIPEISGREILQEVLSNFPSDFDELMGLVTVSEDELSAKMMVLDRQPITIYQDVSSDYRPRPAGTVKQVRALFWLTRIQEYEDTLAEMVPRKNEEADGLKKRQDAASVKLAQLEHEFESAVCAINGNDLSSESCMVASSIPERKFLPDLTLGLEKTTRPVQVDELQIILDYAQTITRRWVGAGGKLSVMEEAEDEDKATEALERGLGRMMSGIDRLVGGYLYEAGGQINESVADQYSEHLLSRKVDGYLSVSRPRVALISLVNNILPLFRNNKPVVDYLARLQKRAPHLFKDGELNPLYDASGLKEGEEAAIRQASKYYVSDNVLQEIGLPVAGGLAGSGLGALGAMLICGGPTTPTGWVCLLAGSASGGAAGSVAGTYASREINQARNAKQILEARQTGITNVSSEEFRVRESGWNSSLAFVGAFGALNMPIGRAVGNWMGRTSWILLRGGRNAIAMAGRLLTEEGAFATALSGLRRAGLQAMTFSTANLGKRMLGRLTTAGKDTWKAFWKGIKQPGSWPFIRFTTGTAGMATDMFIDEKYSLNPDFEINTMIGWVGAAMVFNETAGRHIFGVDAGGNLAALGFNVGSEIIIQTIQDRELTKPDGRRYFIGNAISVATMGIMKGWLKGNRFYGSFPLGRETIVPLATHFPRLARLFRSVVNRNGSVRAWTSRPKELDPLTFVRLTTGAEGGWRWHGGTEKITFSAQKPISPKLFNNMHPDLPGEWILPNKETNFRFRLKDNFLSKEAYDRLPYKSRDRWREVVKPDGRIGYELIGGDMSAKGWLKAMGLDNRWMWEKGKGNQLGGFVTNETMSFDKYVNLNQLSSWGKWSLKKDGNEWRVVWKKIRLPHEKYLELEPVLKEPEFDSWNPMLTFKGSLRNAMVVLPATFLLNKLGAKSMKADPYYLPANRVVDMGLAAFVTWPYVQIPLGIDTSCAQAAGRAVGLLFERIPGNFTFWPIYSEPWIGQDKYFGMLMGGEYKDAFTVANRNMKSLMNPTGQPIIDWDSGPVSGTLWRLEIRALKTLRDKHDELLDEVASRQALENGNHFGQDENEIKLLNFVRMVDGQIDKVKKREEDTLTRSRLTTVLAAYVKSKVMRKLKGNSTDIGERLKDLPLVLQPFADLMIKHKDFFAKIPTVTIDEEWNDFIIRVNNEEYDD